MAGGGREGASLEYTPTWIVALVCPIIVAISLLAERILNFSGKYLLKKNQGSLYQALLKIKEELMLMGFKSLMLAVFQSRIGKICIPKRWMNHWLPCSNHHDYNEATKSTAHFEAFSRRLLAEGADGKGYCEAKGKAPLLSAEALHELHIFIFVLAVTHVVFSALTFFVGGSKIKQWRNWEESIQKREYDPEEAMRNKITHVGDNAFIRKRLSGASEIGFFRWLKSFFKQFYGSVSKLDYITLRLGFVMNRCKANPKFNFYKYMIRAFENDFNKVVGIRLAVKELRNLKITDVAPIIGNNI